MNKYKDETYTKQCLDKVVAKKRWLSEFSTPEVEVLITSGLDQCPLILNSEDHNNGKAMRREFRYEAKWALEDDGEQVIRLAWQSRSFSPNC